MTETLLEVAWASFLLLVLPQLVALLIGRFGQLRGLWWPVIAGILAAPMVYSWVVTGVLAPAPGASSPFVVDDPGMGALAHAVVAFLVQALPWMSER